ncbi:hypothetical protein T12_2772 [Trichinella patagoniensis]|uniref:Uncharacterized protein n=1 Tax=Trichinella patagoniensis TaxID=990121 RepID=A0A0V0XG10_9BILA|nr:hypothetical protein T12_2772 [Trichinella patagoniensis]
MWSCTEHALRDHSVGHLTVVLQSPLQLALLRYQRFNWRAQQ